jgi:predicted metallopeptidase
MKYNYSPEWTAKAREIAVLLEMNHIPAERISVIESKGSKTRRTIARIHGLPKVMKLGMQQEKAFYTIELITELFSKQPEHEKVKTIIHELLHIPENFGGGFRHHKPYVNHKTVDYAYGKLVCHPAYRKENEKLKLSATDTQTKFF